MKTLRWGTLLLRYKIGRYGDKIVTRQGYGYGFEA